MGKPVATNGLPIHSHHQTKVPKNLNIAEQWQKNQEPDRTTVTDFSVIKHAIRKSREWIGYA
jgi:hypothetical protein